MAYAYFAGGCFWCITPTFRSLPGVESVTSGYCGGREQNPSYDDVKHQRTGHRECIRIGYDLDGVDYDRLLQVYLAGVDPFDAGGQFIDRGFSYTLAVFYENDAERAQAQAQLQKLEAESGRKPCVALERFTAFYPAEEYHQDYDLKNPEAFRRELVESGRVQE